MDDDDYYGKYLRGLEDDINNRQGSKSPDIDYSKYPPSSTTSKPQNITPPHQQFPKHSKVMSPPNKLYSKNCPVCKFPNPTKTNKSCGHKFHDYCIEPLKRCPVEGCNQHISYFSKKAKKSKKKSKNVSKKFKKSAKKFGGGATFHISKSLLVEP